MATRKAKAARAPSTRRTKPKGPFRPTFRTPADFTPLGPDASPFARRVRAFQCLANVYERLAEWEAFADGEHDDRHERTAPATLGRISKNKTRSMWWRKEVHEIATRLRAGDDAVRRWSTRRLAIRVRLQLPPQHYFDEHDYIGRPPALKTIRVWLGEGSPT